MSRVRRESSQRWMPRAGALACLLAGAVAVVAHVDAAPGAGLARLVSVSTLTEGPATSVIIETNEPVGYVTTQPDPMTVIVDLRNVTTTSISPTGTTGGAVSSVRIEPGRAEDGATLTRVRLALARPGKPTVRSRWNSVLVEFGGSISSPSASAPQSASAPAPQATPAKPQPTQAAPADKAAGTLTAIDVTSGPEGTRVRLTGTGILKPSSIAPTKGLPARLVIDLPDVQTKVPAVTQVGKGPIDRIRVAINSSKPLVTRAVIDLKYPVSHVVEKTDSGVSILLEPATQIPTPQAAPPPAQPVPQTPPPVPAPVVQPPVAAAQPPAAAAPAPAAAPATQPSPAPAAPSDTRAAGTQTIGATPPPKQYTGHLISFDFQQADLRAVLRSFTEISGLNVIVDESISGTVDVVLKEVPWDQALEIILNSKKLGYVVENNVVRIAPLETLAAEETARQKLKDAQAMSGQLKVLTRALSYAKAEDISAFLKKSVLTTRGEVQFDKRTNTIIVTDLPAALANAEDLIATLDRAEPQVEIEARIVQVNRESARALGVQWGVNGRMIGELGNTSGLAFPATASVSGRTGGTQGNPTTSTQVPSGANLPVTGATSGIGLAMGTLNGSFNLDVALSALEHAGHAKLLSQPKVMMQNNIEAEMTQGVQIPIQTISNNTVTVNFKDAALTLRVKPQITASETVILDVFLENATPDYSRSVNGIPPIDTQRAKSQVLVRDTETIVIGGITTSQETTGKDGVPGLSRIPLLGWLFKRDTSTTEGRELLIFITPRIKK